MLLPGSMQWKLGSRSSRGWGQRGQNQRLQGAAEMMNAAEGSVQEQRAGTV